MCRRPRIWNREVLCCGAGMQVDLDGLVARLVEHGFVAVPAVEVPGEFSRRGCILDVFPPELPVLCGSSSGTTKSIPYALSMSARSEGQAPERSCHHLPSRTYVVGELFAPGYLLRRRARWY